MGIYGPQELQSGAQGRAKVAVDIPVQAPIGGWNTRDSFDDLPPEDAAQMDNWLPSLGAVQTRKGRSVYYQRDDIPANMEPVETLAVYESGNNLRLIGSDNGYVYDITDDIALGSGFTGSRWVTANFDGYLVMVNGVDTPQEYDGTTLSALSPSLSGPSNPIGCFPYKNRMYYWDSNSQSVWYTALYARAGTCTEFDLSMLNKLGGSILAISTITHDGGSGPDDYFVVILTSGDVIIYQGSSPASTANWSVVGIYNIGQPLGDSRCTIKVGGDLMIMTTLDIVPLSRILQGAEALTQRSKISGAMQEVAEFYGSPYFDAIMFPAGKLGLFNVPAPGGEDTYQFALNLVTGAWSRITGWKVYSWAVIENELFIGGDDGCTYKAFDGYVDEEAIYDTSWTSESNAIEEEFISAWMNFGSPGNKSFIAIKPLFRSSYRVDYNIDIAVDFAIFGNMDFPPADVVTGTPWGSPWGSPWGLAVGTDNKWKIVNGYGRYAAFHLKTTTVGSLQWGATIWHMEAGTRI